MALGHIGMGRTEPGNTAWRDYGAAGIVVTVDTSAAGFTETPMYITSLGGRSGHWHTTGATSIYNPTRASFNIYVRRPDGSPLTPADANGAEWHINWIGIGP